MQIVAEEGWDGLTMPRLAERLGVDTVALYDEVPGRAALLRRFGDTFDRAMASTPRGDLAGMGVRDRLFDLMMRRFEAMQPHRDGLERLTRDARRAPELLAAGCCTVDRMADRLLDLADIRTSGLRRRLARRALSAVYLATYRTWTTDGSEDLASTMAELDKRLGQLDRLASFACRMRRAGGRRRAESRDEPPADAMPA
ncbi:MAG: TetR family transcriptional regulator [Geminicoccaceae bacterium]|nr:TetR family transcriptional regulator [Geminicoccaceae bacterium]